MSLVKELDEMRMKVSGPTGSRANMEEAQNYYLNLIAGLPSYEESLSKKMRERDVRTQDLRREKRRAREELTNIRPQAYARYGAPRRGAMPKMRPEDLTAQIAAEEASKRREISRLSDEVTARVGGREDAVERALSAYETKAALAKQLADQAARDYELSVSASRGRSGPSLSEVLNLLGWEQEQKDRRSEAENLMNRIDTEVAEAMRTGEYVPIEYRGDFIPANLNLTVPRSPEGAMRVAGRVLADIGEDYSEYAVSAARQMVANEQFPDRFTNYYPTLEPTPTDQMSWLQRLGQATQNWWGKGLLGR